jgi:MFS family permease
MVASTSSDETPRPAASQGYRLYVVGVLFVAYVFSYVDRTILTLLVKPIRESLRISDTQVSLLHGLAFAIFYTVLGIPIARLADRANRVRIIATGIVVWSAMTALCGLARNFWQLFLARVGVGVGEAALSPAAYSILGDYYRGPALARALSLYTSAIYIGAGLALMIGGALIASVQPMHLPVVGRLEPWQVVFLFVGLPGLLVALLMRTVREPPRTALATRGGAGRQGGEAPDSSPGLPLPEVLRYLRTHAGAYGLLIVAFSVAALLWNGAMAWIPTFFIRQHGWTPAEVGLRFGPVLLVCGTAGVIFGGLLGGWFAARGYRDANPRVGLVSAALILPAGLLAPTLDGAGASLAAFAVFCFAGSMPYGAAGAALTEITPNQMRAQVIALYFLVQNLAGIGLGPTVVAVLTDRLFGDDLAVGQSLMVVTAVAAPLSLLLVGLSLKPFRRCIAALEF